MTKAYKPYPETMIAVMYKGLEKDALLKKRAFWLDHLYRSDARQHIAEIDRELLYK